MHIILGNPGKNYGGVVRRKKYFRNTLGVPLCKCSKEMIVTGAGSGGINNTANAWAAAVV